MSEYNGTTQRRIERKKRQLLSPSPFGRLDELEQDITPRSEYVGPGPWIAAAENEKPKQKKRK